MAVVTSVGGSFYLGQPLSLLQSVGSLLCYFFLHVVVGLACEKWFDISWIYSLGGPDCHQNFRMDFSVGPKPCT